MVTAPREKIRVLHVDDDPDFAGLTATCLERESGRFVVETATSADEGLERVADYQPDCVVSDYDMPGMDGIGFLETVRDDYPEIPFILFTGTGSEEVASDALTAGATDYLQKQSGMERYELLANRIENAVEQYQSKKRLRGMQEEYAAVFENAQNGLLLVQVENDGFRYQQCNPQAVELIGRQKKAIVGKTPQEVLGPENGTKVAGAYRTCIERREPVAYTVTLDFPRGEVVRECEVAPVSSDGAVEQLVVEFRDITEQRQRKRELRQERDRLEALFEAIPEPIANVEFTDNGPILREANDAFEETFGYEASAATGENINDLIVPDDASTRAEAERLDDRAQTGDQLTREVKRETSDGLRNFLFRSAPITQDGVVTRQFSVFIDIDERKRREEALSALHDATRNLIEAPNKQTVAERAVETARTVLDQPINGIWFHDSEDNILRPITMTEEAAALLDEQPTYTGSGSLSWEAFEDGELRVFDDVRTEPERLVAESVIESEMIMPLGEYGVMNIGATEPANFSDIDISLAQILGETVEASLARAEREQQLRTQRRELERQNERLERFTSVVSHDLRNPLQVADGRMELAQSECDSPHLDDVADALDRMDTLIQDLLTLARQGNQVQQTESVALVTMVDGCWQSVETADANLVCKTEYQVRADDSRLKQLLENLFANAVEHGGDSVTITVGDLDDGFYVADDGSGVPVDEREAVFDAGYSTSDEGTGFGLNIVQEIAEAHGWDVTVTDSETGGARFEITGVQVM